MNQSPPVSTLSQKNVTAVDAGRFIRDCPNQTLLARQHADRDITELKGLLYSRLISSASHIIWAAPA